ncbi:MAG TPA: GTP-binding protein [Candidatus Competibacter sp.]|nr:GTP-binding protein [Candidatus Competibacter sp.]HRY14368.1 GTP-binding protein [Candidatus Competibacteraceae bacterium]
MNTADARIPVTVLTGFLGAGKTTLLNRILTEQHGQRIAVIENEFGEIGIDQALVINAEEEIFAMNNGCLCCTVRGDLIRILGNLMKRRAKFDRIVVETTGLANPGPVAQTFFMDDEMKDNLRLDGIVTVVDCKHIADHLDLNDECRAQVAFADTLLLNKTDLVDAAAVEGLESRLRAMNGLARMQRTAMAQADLRDVLDLGGFDLQRALDLNPAFLEPEYPFEWAGWYVLPAGESTLVLEDGPDPAMRLILLSVSEHDALAVSKETAIRLFSAPVIEARPGDQLKPDVGCYRLRLSQPGSKRFPLQLPRTAHIALFTEHHPDEFTLRVLDPHGQPMQPLFARAYNPGHTHDDAVSSVGIVEERPVNIHKLNLWLSELLREQGADIFRMKGVLHLADNANRFVFQGVHMLFDGQADRPWREDEPRQSQMIFIGRHLNRVDLTTGFQACLD